MTTTIELTDDEAEVINHVLHQRADIISRKMTQKLKYDDEQIAEMEEWLSAIDRAKIQTR